VTPPHSPSQLLKQSSALQATPTGSWYKLPHASRSHNNILPFFIDISNPNTPKPSFNLGLTFNSPFSKSLLNSQSPEAKDREEPRAKRTLLL